MTWNYSKHKYCNVCRATTKKMERKKKDRIKKFTFHAKEGIRGQMELKHT